MANKFLNGIEVFGKTKTNELIATGSIKINSDDVALKKDFDSYDTSAEVNTKLSSYLLKDSTGLQTISSDLALTGYVLIDNLAIDTLKIKGLTASSDVTFSAGLTVGTTLNANNIVATNSIKVGTENVALKSDLTDFITLEDLTIDNLPDDVVITSELNNILKNYDTASAAAGKFKPIAWGNDSTNKATSFYADSIIATNSIKIGNDDVALAKNIPNVSSYITKDVEDLTNYTNTENLNTLLAAKADINTVYTKSEIDTKNSAFLLKESTGLQTISSDLALTGYVLIDNLSIDTLKIKGLTASSDVTFNAGLTVGTTLNANNIVASNSIKVGDTEVALKTDIPTVPDVSSYITKDVNDLTNYTTTENLNTLLDDKADKATTLAGYGITDAYTKTEADGNYLKLINLDDSQVNVSFSNHKGVKFTFLSDISGANVGFGAPEETEIDNGRIFEVRAANALGYDNSIKFDPLNSAIIKKVSNVNPNYLPPVDTPPDVSTEIEYALSIPSKTGTIATLGDIPNVSSFITKDVSDLTNYTTTDDLERIYAKLTDITAVLKFQGSISTVDNLPTGLNTTTDIGKVYNIETAGTINNQEVKAGDNVVWTVNGWDVLAGNIDLSNYVEKTELNSYAKLTDIENFVTTDSVYTKSEIDAKNSSFLVKDSTGLQTISSDLALTGYVLIDNLSIDTLKIKGLTASSDVIFNAGLTVGTTLNANNVVATNSIKIGADDVALAKNIPNVSSYITKDVNDLTNYTNTENLNTLLDDKADKATTLEGYGITNAYTQSEIDGKLADYLVKDSTGLQTISSDLALTGYVLIDNLAIDTLNIKGLTASSDVTFNAGLTVGTTINANNIVATNSIKVGETEVALKTDIPTVPEINIFEETIGAITSTNGLITWNIIPSTQFILKPLIQVYDSGGNQIYCNVKYVKSTNTITIEIVSSDNTVGGEYTATIFGK